MIMNIDRRDVYLLNHAHRRQTTCLFDSQKYLSPEKSEFASERALSAKGRSEHDVPAENVFFFHPRGIIAQGCNSYCIGVSLMEAEGEFRH
jgi:hypothetical protein